MNISNHIGEANRNEFNKDYLGKIDYFSPKKTQMINFI